MLNHLLPSSLCVCVCVNLWPTWISMGYSVDVGSVEDADARVSPILHAHAHAEEQSGHGAHQEDHAEDDARNCGAPGTNEHTHTKLSKVHRHKMLLCTQVYNHKKRMQSCAPDNRRARQGRCSCVESKESQVSKVRWGSWHVEGQLVWELALFYLNGTQLPGSPGQRRFKCCCFFKKRSWRLNLGSFLH